MADFTVGDNALIGFSANKTEEQAKGDTSSNRMTICKEKTLYMNGQRLGLTENEAAYLKKKIDEEFSNKVGLTLSVSPNIQDAAAPTSVTVTVKTSFSNSPVDADTTPTITATGMSPTLTKSSTGVYTCTLEGKNTAVSVSVSAKIKGIAKSQSTTIGAYHKIRYGVSALELIPANGPIPSNFEYRNPTNNAAGTYVFNFTNNTYAFILIPNGVTLPQSMQGDNPSGEESPLPVPFVKLANVVVGGVTYTQLRIAAMQAESTHTVLFKE